MDEYYYQVCIPHSKHEHFTYYSHLNNIPLGARVWVPFIRGARLGVVIHKVSPPIAFKLKEITQVLDSEALIDASILSLCQWMASYYQVPLSEVISLALPKKLRMGQSITLPRIRSYQLNCSLTQAQALFTKKQSKQLLLLEFLRNNSHTQTDILQHGFTKKHIQGLVEKNLLITQEGLDLSAFYNTSALSAPLTLNDEQTHAVEQIKKKLGGYHCFLVDGVTGSGKTEVYLQIISDCLKAGQQILILVPEIGLTPQLLARFKDRFHEPIVVIHSHLNDSERAIAWQLAKENIAKLVIGTRAAIFTPMPALGLIVIDEEHDASFKQMDTVRYNARDTALVRAYAQNIPVILGSATPSLETLHNCERNKYTQLFLKRQAQALVPLHYQLVDLRSVAIEEGLAPAVLATIGQHLEQQNQVLIFVNRRGFAPIFLCHACGWIADCSACDSHLTFHKSQGQLICHHCGLVQRRINQCKHCQHQELVPVGVGTQRLYDYLQKQFPNTPMVRIDRDEIRKKNALDQALERIYQQEVQLIVGTQMLAKGHHFPRLTLVVVVDTDSGFYNHDFRALEQLGQLLTQVAGRAGRAEYAGHVMIQTHLPHHPLLNTLIREGYSVFAAELMKMREQAGFPPYQFLAVIRVEDKNRERVIRLLLEMKNYLQSSPLQLLGPAPAPLARKAHYHRMQLVIKSSTRPLLQNTLSTMRQWLFASKIANNIRWNIDIDPHDLS